MYGIPGSAQTASQRKQIVRHYDGAALRSSSNPYLQAIKQQRIAVERYARLHQVPLKIRNRTGSWSRFSRIDEKGNRIYLKPYNNVDAARTIGVNQLYPGGGLGLNLSGKGMIVGLWDAGRVRGQHELLKGKIKQKDNPEEYDDHATQVAGTLVGRKLSSPKIGR